MVRMAQDFSMRAPLDRRAGQFRLGRRRSRRRRRAIPRRAWKRSPLSMLDDLDKDTVDFRPNYDEKEQEPTVLPARFPNLLVNGAGGIAVGMATNIPPHQSGREHRRRAGDHGQARHDRRRADGDPARPRFPHRRSHFGPRRHPLGLFQTGRGSIIMRARVHTETLAQGARGADRHGDCPIRSTRRR